VGRIRYLGVVLYDADQIQMAASMPDHELVDHQRDMILDPHNPEVVAQAERDGIHFSMIEAAQKSPVYRFVKEWQLALPLHPEFRTIPMLFYIPPLLPVIGQLNRKGIYSVTEEDYFGAIDQARVPLQYMARLFAAGNESHVRAVFEKLIAMRLYKRAEQVGDVSMARANELLAQVGLTPVQAEEIYRLTSLPTFDERFVIPPMHREEAIELIGDPYEFKAETGVGFREKPQRGL
jgi:nitrate reductase beta subunit